LFIGADGQKDMQIHHMPTRSSFHVQPRSNKMISIFWEIGQGQLILFAVKENIETRGTLIVL
jgi:hypothetical protein